MARIAVTLLLLVFSCCFGGELRDADLSSSGSYQALSVFVTVRAGWSLAEIAQGVGMSLESLMKINYLQSSEISAGQILKTQPYTDKKEVVVTWYQDGTQRADGNPFDPDDVTVVAHKWLPFGTKVRLTLLGSKRSIVVIVRDRGPYVTGRDFDLSRGAARELGIVEKGVVRCEVEILSSPN